MVSIKARMMVIALICLTAVALCVTVGVWSTERLAGLSQRVFVSKDVVADILPPPMYLIEMCLVVSRLFEKSLEPNAAQKERLNGWRKNTRSE
jgi:methyl-accepting chemotaxis protein